MGEPRTPQIPAMALPRPKTKVKTSEELMPKAFTMSLLSREARTMSPMFVLLIKNHMPTIITIPDENRKQAGSSKWERSRDRPPS